MPVQRVRTQRGVGYRWGKRGKIYYGEKAREQAAAQGKAAYASGYAKKKRKRK